MPQLRQDPITNRWVTIATERAKRPKSFTQAAKTEVAPSAQCPFCEGHEQMTPPETMAYRAAGTPANTPGWSLRTVPNLYPAFGPSSGPPQRQDRGPYRAMEATGVHEVIVHGPDHGRDLADLGVEKVDEILRAYLDRYQAAAAQRGVQYVLIILNHGKEAGASLEHPHSQVFGIPLVPDAVAEEIAGTRRYRRERGTCPYCDLLTYEGQKRERMIYENSDFAVFAPFASRVPFESWIVPKRHSARFEAISADERRALAEALRALTAKLKTGLNDPPHNLVVHAAPVVDADDEYHWHVEVLPKLILVAGFELGSGVMINPTPPESAAEFLRAVDPEAAEPQTSS